MQVVEAQQRAVDLDPGAVDPALGALGPEHPGRGHDIGFGVECCDEAFDEVRVVAGVVVDEDQRLAGRLGRREVDGAREAQVLTGLDRPREFELLAAGADLTIGRGVVDHDRLVRRGLGRERAQSLARARAVQAREDHGGCERALRHAD